MYNRYMVFHFEASIMNFKDQDRNFTSVHLEIVLVSDIEKSNDAIPLHTLLEHPLY